MIAYDIVIVNSIKETNKDKPVGMYIYSKSFEYIVLLTKEYIHLSNEKLCKIYGVKEI